MTFLLSPLPPPPHLLVDSVTIRYHLRNLRSLTWNLDVYCGDPVNIAISWAESLNVPIPFICSANEKRPGGDWETGVVGYEVLKDPVSPSDLLCYR